MKKFLALALAIIMVLALSVPALAAADGSITISNTTSGKSYTAYKVFDATYSGDKVAYFYDGSNATFLAALKSTESPFTLTGPVDGVYNVIRKEAATDDAIITFIKNNAANFGTGTTKDGTGEALEFTGLAYGYYYITTTNGTAVTIDSALKDVTVIDKNQDITNPDKQEKVESGTWVYEGAFDDTAEKPTANVGDTVNYKVIGNFTQYVGEDIVKALKFTDTMSSGLTADQNVVIKINGTLINTPDDYTVSYTLKNNDTTDDTTDDYWVTEISIPTATIDAVSGEPTFLYNANNTYEITYSAKIDKDAIIDGEEENTVNLKYTNENDDDIDVGNDKTEVKTYNVTLNKKDGKNSAATTDDSALAGAKFNLFVKDDTTPISVILIAGDGTATSTTSNTYRLPEAGETTGLVTELVAGADGKIIVQGLKNGEYEFEETEAPSGYNKLTERTQVVTIENENASIDVVNNSGTELPSTGGIGTTIFYVLGGLLVAFAVVFLITKTRMSKEQ